MPNGRDLDNPDDWYSRWAVAYATVLGLTRDEDLTMVESWRPHFAAGCTEAEMTAALGLIVRGGGVRWRGDHLKAIRQALDTVRSRPSAGAADARPVPLCPACSGSGRVRVLDPACYLPGGGLRAGPLSSTVVACNCAAGVVVARGDPSLTRLADYERERPGWRALLWRHLNSRKADGHEG
jgi:hypothetical protein